MMLAECVVQWLSISRLPGLWLENSSSVSSRADDWRSSLQWSVVICECNGESRFCVVVWWLSGRIKRANKFFSSKSAPSLVSSSGQKKPLAKRRKNFCCVSRCQISRSKIPEANNNFSSKNFQQDFQPTDQPTKRTQASSDGERVCSFVCLSQLARLMSGRMLAARSESSSRLSAAQRAECGWLQVKS